jgi:hypothetical protein
MPSRPYRLKEFFIGCTAGISYTTADFVSEKAYTSQGYD